jgi:hypothetical protein
MTVRATPYMKGNMPGPTSIKRAERIGPRIQVNWCAD